MADSNFQKLADTFVSKFGTDLFGDVGTFISNISPLFASGFCLYIVIVALDAYNRGLDENVVDLSKRMIGWLVIIAFAFNASQYTSLAQIVYAMPDELAQAFGKKVDVKLFDSASMKIDVIVSQIERAQLDLTGLDNLPANIGLTILQYTLILETYLLLAIIFGYYVIGKIQLALNLMIGPLFIGSMLFPPTRQYGMNWVGQCLNTIITIGLLSVLMGMEIGYFKDAVESNIQTLQNLPSGIEVAAEASKLIGLFTLMTVVFILAAWKVPALATALTGGASLEGAGAGMDGLAARKAGGAAKGIARESARGARRLYRKVRNRGGDIKSG